MKQPVLIRMCSSSDNGDGEPTIISSAVPGDLTVENGIYTLSYEQILQDEGDHTVMSQHIDLLVKPDEIEMHRTGDVSTCMVFRKNYRFEGVYHTPFGDMSMGIFTTRVVTDLQDDHGSFDLQYQLDTQGMFASLLTMSASWTVQRS